MLGVIAENLDVMAIQFTFLCDAGVIVRDDLLQLLDSLTAVVDRKRLVFDGIF